MSPEGTVVASRVWKRFRADRRHVLLRDEVRRLRARRQIRPRWSWAVRDVSISVEQGSSIGLVGANGSGKSTLLKLLNGVTLPYAGRIDVTGRIGALIEVRSGIHPELSGRENAFIVGALLGLSRRDVARRFDEIVEFSELDRAIDRQVKYYSTGMQMRLGFAVAAFLEPDVLLVDEVLAVGDAAFQQRCLDRMRMVMSRGTTLVFVSHDLAAIEATCAQALWMGEGRALAGGPVGDVLCAYRLAVEHQLSVEGSDAGPIRLLKARVVGPDGGAPRTQERLDVALVFESDAEEIARVCIGVSEGSAAPVFTVWRDLHLVGGSGDTPVRCSIRQLPLPRGRYRVCAGVYGREPSGAGGVSDLMSWRPVAEFDVSGPDLDPTPPAILRLAPVHVAVEWEVG